VNVRLLALTLLFVTCVSTVNAQSFLMDLKAERNPATRSKKALALADAAVDNAQDFYTEGDVEKGNAQLQDMIWALNEASQLISGGPQIAVVQES
jgi:hypothetical protein